jgi:predicted MFS family arabinose efflux permease
MSRASLWGHRDFVKLWTGQAISQIGSRITRTALPFAAVLTLGAGPFEMGILAGASAAAMLVFGLFAGALADRLRRRPLLIAADLARAVILFSVPLAAARHSLTMTHLYVVAAAAGIFTVLFDVSYQAYVPSLVDRENVLQANAKLALSESIAEVSGPGLAGFLVQALTAPLAVAFDAVSFLASAFSLTLIRKQEAKPRRATEAHIRHEIAEGLRVTWRDPYLRAMGLRLFQAALFMGFFGSTYVLLVAKVLALPPSTVGMIVSVGGAFAILGSASAERLVRRFGVGPAFIGAVVFTGFTSFLHPMAHGSFALCCAFLVAGQFGDFAWPLLNVTETSLRQSAAPPAVLGRVNSAMHLLFNGMIPVGSFLGGMIAAGIGVRATMIVGAGGYLLSSLWLLFSPVRQLRELPQAAANAAASAAP